MSTQTKPTIPTVTLTQQSVNLVRQLVAATGWAKTVDDIYLGGQLLVDVLPRLEPLDWVKTDTEVATMTTAQKAAYLKRDQAWTTKELAFPLSAEQTAAIKKAFDSYIETSAKEGKLGPNLFFNEIIDKLGFRNKTE